MHQLISELCIIERPFCLEAGMREGTGNQDPDAMSVSGVSTVATSNRPMFPQRPLDSALVAAILGFLQKMIWPGLLMVVLLLFKGPITTALEAAATAGGTSIDVAGFKLTLPKSEIPSPPDAIKSTLPQLDPDLIANIVSNYGGHNRVDTCYQSENDDELEADSTKSRLKSLGLINFNKEEFRQAGKVCPSASITTYTRNYDLVRSYLIQVTSSLKFSQ